MRLEEDVYVFSLMDIFIVIICFYFFEVGFYFEEYYICWILLEIILVVVGVLFGVGILGFIEFVFNNC